MNVLQICDYAARYRGNFIESLDFLKRNTFDEGDTMYYAFPERMLKRNNSWFAEFERENNTVIYGNDEKKRISVLRKYIKQNQIDIVHAHFTDIKTDLCVDLACAGLNVRKLKHYRSGFGSFNAVKRLVSSLCYRGWRAVLCVSPFVAEEAAHNIPSCRAQVLTDAVYLPRLDEYEELDRALLGIPESALLCLAIGYDYELKGIGTACKAVEQLRKKREAYLAVCVASNAENIKKRITQDFGTFPEWIRLLPPRQDIASYYRMSDVYVQASKSEGFCYAIIEAAYCEKPVVASDCPGMKSHAEKSFDFLWFKNGDENDLAKKLEMADVKKDDMAMIEKNRRSAIENYGIEAMCKKLYRVYKDII